METDCLRDRTKVFESKATSIFPVLDDDCGRYYKRPCDPVVFVSNMNKRTMVF